MKSFINFYIYIIKLNLNLIIFVKKKQLKTNSAKNNEYKCIYSGIATELLCIQASKFKIMLCVVKDQKKEAGVEIVHLEKTKIAKWAKELSDKYEKK